MSEQIKLEAQSREITGKQVKQLRSENLIPAVVYGPTVEGAIQIKIDRKTLALTLRQSGGTNVIEIAVGDERYYVLVRDVQREILSGDIVHVDFYAVDMTVTTNVEVPVVTYGVSEVVETGEAMLITPNNVVEIECLPADIPSELTLDVSRLVEIGDYLTAGDLILPENVTLLTDADLVLVRTQIVRAMEEEEGEGEDEDLEGIDAEGVEVIKKGKEEEEDF